MAAILRAISMVSELARPQFGSAQCNGLRSAPASALSTIPAAVAFTGFTANVFVLTCAPQTSAIPALILSLLNDALCSYAIARDWCG
jgi:hypothetical protein